MSSVLIETNSAFVHLNCVAGGFDENENYSDQVLSFNTDTNTWEEVGRMKKKRSDHGVSVVPANEFSILIVSNSAKGINQNRQQNNLIPFLLLSSAQ